MSKPRLAGTGLEDLVDQIRQSIEEQEGTYTQEVHGRRKLLRSKILEEAHEVVDFESQENLIHEMADLLYFLTILAYREGVEWEEVFEELKTREKLFFENLKSVVISWCSRRRRDGYEII